MTPHRDNSTDEINRLTAELAEARDDLDQSQRARSSSRRWEIGWAITAWFGLAMLVFLVVFMQVRAPLSAKTRGAARWFCDALEEQEREEQEARESP